MEKGRERETEGGGGGSPRWRIHAGLGSTPPNRGNNHCFTGSHLAGQPAQNEAGTRPDRHGDRVNLLGITAVDPRRHGCCCGQPAPLTREGEGQVS